MSDSIRSARVRANCPEHGDHVFVGARKHKLTLIPAQIDETMWGYYRFSCPGDELSGEHWVVRTASRATAQLLTEAGIQIRFVDDLEVGSIVREEAALFFGLPKIEADEVLDFVTASPELFEHAIAREIYQEPAPTLLLPQLQLPS